MMTIPHNNPHSQYSNFVVGGLQIIAWLIFKPSSWMGLVNAVDPTLSPDFYLAGLSAYSFRNTKLWRLLLQAHLVPAILCSALILATGHSLNAVIFGLVASMVWTICMDVCISVPAGIMSLLVLNLGIGFTTDVNSGYAITEVLGATAGVAGGTIITVASIRNPSSAIRQISGAVAGSVFAGSAIGIGFGGLAILEGASRSGLNEVVNFAADTVATAGVRPDFSVFVGAGLDVGLGVLISMGLGCWIRTKKWKIGLIFGIGIGLLLGSVVCATFFLGGGIAYSAYFGPWASVGLGVTVGSLFNFYFIFPYIIAERIAGEIAAAIGSAIGAGIGWEAFWTSAGLHPVLPNVPMILISGFVGAVYPWWRPMLFYPLQLVLGAILYRSEEQRSPSQRSLLSLHPVNWDERQRLKLFGLDDHLLLVAERNTIEGQNAIKDVALTNQHWAAQFAQIELDARYLERCNDVFLMAKAHSRLAAGDLEGPVSALLRSFSRTSQDTAAALNQESRLNRRLALTALADRIDGLVRELSRSSDVYAKRFLPIAIQWSHTVSSHAQELARVAEERQEIESPYSTGAPLTDAQEIFVGRTEISMRIADLVNDRRRLPLLLYGQRRMGKTSLLNNLGRLLPSTVVPLFIDLQGPASKSSDHGGFLYNLTRGMTDSALRYRQTQFPSVTREAFIEDPFTCFDLWLDQVELLLESKTALLLLDEFEALDPAFTTAKFSEDAVLGMLRHLIQHRPRFTVLIAGSHTLREFQRWASYLINVQVIHITYLREQEAQQLIEKPVKDFPLRYQTQARQRVIDVTRSHPFLIQLLCSEIVAVKNEQDPSIRRQASVSDVDAAIPAALDNGSFFFADIEINQIDECSRKILKFVAKRGANKAVGLNDLGGVCSDPEILRNALDLLLRRDILETVDDGFQFQVELVRRWFAKSVGL